MKVNGVNELQAKLKGIGAKGRQVVIQTTEGVAREIENDAKEEAPNDYGKLRQSINALPISESTWEVSANEVYAPYIEFGTGAAVEIPSGWEDVAKQFKGKGIKSVNIHPQPFLIPAFKKGSKNYKKILEKELKNLLK